MKPRLIDAQKMAREHPKTFEVPDPDVLAGLKPGTSVKVCNGKERFWVKLTAVMGDDDLQGVVSTYVTARRYGVGDTIQFRKRNVYDVHVKKTSSSILSKIRSMF